MAHVPHDDSMTAPTPEPPAPARNSTQRSSDRPADAAAAEPSWAAANGDDDPPSIFLSTPARHGFAVNDEDEGGDGETDYELSYSHSDPEEVQELGRVSGAGSVEEEEDYEEDEGEDKGEEDYDDDDDDDGGGGEDDTEEEEHGCTDDDDAGQAGRLKDFDASDSMFPARKRLMLLDLPVDVLRLVVQEVSNISDLTCLARTNWTLHSLSIPVMYSRFDIVWPETQGPIDEGKSVDALTFGLSTLCLGSSFAYRTRRALRRHGGASAQGSALMNQDRLRGSDYAKFTRKFALSNGPSDLVAEYVVGRESGKMLGTLVALALKRMVNLESFVWDMPTGVLSEVFMALASLQDHTPDGSCNLKSVWVRWHCNSDADDPSSSQSNSYLLAHLPPHSSTLTPVGHSVPPDPDAAPPAPPPSLPYHNSRVEHPSFSVLPPLRCLTVLDIDEMAYLDEMAVLIAESVPALRELRVGMSSHVMQSPRFHPWDGVGLDQVNHDARWPGEATASNRRLGGVLGVLVGHFFDIKKKATTPPATTSSALSEGANASSSHSGAVVYTPDSPSSPLSGATEPRKCDGRLKLEVLGLERVSLSIYVCSRALDWSVLTSITLLQCPYSWLLWRELQRRYGPIRSTSSTGGGSRRPATPLYQLCLKKIHTDLPCQSLSNMIKTALRPNSLETFFLHDRRPTHTPDTPIESIFRGVIKRHKASLKRVLIESSYPGLSDSGQRLGNWTMTRDMVLYITSGRMKKLRELCITIHHHDWHTLIQRLPNMPQLRSLYIPSFTGLPPKMSVDVKELAQQMVDVVSIKPELPLCFVAFKDKCFEIMEDREDKNTNGASGAVVPGAGDIDVIDADVLGDGTGQNELATEDEGDGDAPPSNGEQEEVDAVSEESDTESACSADSSDSQYAGPPRFKVREIMFYDDKVEMFKARHATL